MLAKLILDILMSKGSKKAVYFFYSADLGTAILVGIILLILSFTDPNILMIFIVVLLYVLYFFNVGRKRYTDQNAKTFAINLLKWSATSVPVELALLALTVMLAASGG